MNKEEFSEEEKRILSQFVTNIESNVFCLKNLPEEVIAVLFAFYSRSENTLRENLLKVLQEKDVDLTNIRDNYCPQNDKELNTAKEKAAQFHEKWVINYGHSSIAEHANIKFAIQNISNVLTKIIEDNRLASFTEKSSRYVIFDKTAFYKPKKIMESELGPEYVEVMHVLFDTYEKLQQPMMKFIRERMPKQADTSERAYEASVKAKACDNIRYLLPAATLTSLGLAINARSAVHAIKKLLSSSLEESQQIGKQIMEEGMKICPTLLRHAKPNDYIYETNKVLNELTKQKFSEPTSVEKPVKIISYDKEAEDKLVAAILYKYSSQNFTKILNAVKEMNKQQKEKILDEYLKRIKEYDWPMRELEHINFTMEMIMDLGAFRDVQRHRIATQTVQLNTCAHGYDTPADIIDAGFQKEYDFAMNTAKELYKKIAKRFPLEAQYIVPYAFKKQMLFTWNLREIEHFIRLRSSEHGHESYRKIAQKCHEEIEKLFPLLARYLRVDKNEYYLGRLKSEIKFDDKLRSCKRD